MDESRYTVWKPLYTTQVVLVDQRIPNPLTFHGLVLHHRGQFIVTTYPFNINMT